MSRKDFMIKQIVFINAKDGDKVSFSNDNMVVTNSDGKIKHQSTCHLIGIVFIIGSITVTSVFMEKSKTFGFSVVFMKTSYRIINVLPSGLVGNTQLRKKQYSLFSLDIGKFIIANKMENQIKTLEKYKNIKKCSDLESMNELLSKFIFGNFDLYQLLSIEGQCSKLYFKNIFSPFSWESRKPRTKIDALNTILDIGYTILFSFIEAILNYYDFDLYVGVFHKEFYKRKSLVCDIMEPFRCIIDDCIRKAFMLKQFKFEDFLFINNGYTLDITKNSHYSTIIAKCLIERKEEIFLYIQRYYRSFMKGSEISEFPIFVC